MSHRPKPGPGYWEWRCLECSRPVDEHPSLSTRIKGRVADLLFCTECFRFRFSPGHWLTKSFHS